MSKTIVVVEDFNVSRKVIVSTLKKEGYLVLEAADGREALTLFDGKMIDLLITDFNMPFMDGSQLISEIRTLNQYEYLPILLLTTEVRLDKIQKAIEGNITALVKKPFETHEFINIVKKALR